MNTYRKDNKNNLIENFKNNKLFQNLTKDCESIALIDPDAYEYFYKNFLFIFENENKLTTGEIVYKNKKFQTSDWFKKVMVNYILNYNPKSINEELNLSLPQKIARKRPSKSPKKFRDTKKNKTISLFKLNHFNNKELKLKKEINSILKENIGKKKGTFKEISEEDNDLELNSDDSKNSDESKQYKFDKLGIAKEKLNAFKIIQKAKLFKPKFKYDSCTKKKDEASSFIHKFVNEKVKELNDSIKVSKKQLRENNYVIKNINNLNNIGLNRSLCSICKSSSSKGLNSSDGGNILNTESNMVDNIYNLNNKNKYILNNINKNYFSLNESTSVKDKLPLIENNKTCSNIKEDCNDNSSSKCQISKNFYGFMNYKNNLVNLRNNKEIRKNILNLNKTTSNTQRNLNKNISVPRYRFNDIIRDKDNNEVLLIKRKISERKNYFTKKDQFMDLVKNINKQNFNVLVKLSTNNEDK